MSDLQRVLVPHLAFFSVALNRRNIRWVGVDCGHGH